MKESSKATSDSDQQKDKLGLDIFFRVFFEVSNPKRNCTPDQYPRNHYNLAIAFDQSNKLSSRNQSVTVTFPQSIL